MRIDLRWNRLPTVMLRRYPGVFFLTEDVCYQYLVT